MILPAEKGHIIHKYITCFARTGKLVSLDECGGYSYRLSEYRLWRSRLDELCGLAPVLDDIIP
jgi:hypothetical protein